MMKVASFWIITMQAVIESPYFAGTSRFDYVTTQCHIPKNGILSNTAAKL
jgi:hypothetical protein